MATRWILVSESRKCPYFIFIFFPFFFYYSYVHTSLPLLYFEGDFTLVMPSSQWISWEALTLDGEMTDNEEDSIQQAKMLHSAFKEG
jgi:hypothetical protein